MIKTKTKDSIPLAADIARQVGNRCGRCWAAEHLGEVVKIVWLDDSGKVPDNASIAGMIPGALDNMLFLPEPGNRIKPF